MIKELLWTAGRQYDKYGNMVDWWGNQSAQNFNDLAQCFVDEYSEFTVYGHHVNFCFFFAYMTADVFSTVWFYVAHSLYIFICYMYQWMIALCGAGALLFPPCLCTSSSFALFSVSLSLIGFTYFLLLSTPSFSTRIVLLRFQAGGRRKWPNLGLVCCVCVICIP